MVGAPALELSHSCTNEYNDLFVRISQVDPQGGSRNVSDGYRASAPASGTVHIELDPVAHTFPAGSRLRLMISGGSHPRFLRNLGTGESPVSGNGIITAKHTVHLGEASRLTLPAGDRPPSTD